MQAVHEFTSAIEQPGGLCRPAAHAAHVLQVRPIVVLQSGHRVCGPTWYCPAPHPVKPWKLQPPPVTHPISGWQHVCDRAAQAASTVDWPARPVLIGRSGGQAVHASRPRVEQPGPLNVPAGQSAQTLHS